MIGWLQQLLLGVALAIAGLFAWRSRSSNRTQQRAQAASERAGSERAAIREAHDAAVVDAETKRDALATRILRDRSTAGAANDLIDKGTL